VVQPGRKDDALADMEISAPIAFAPARHCIGQSSAHDLQQLSERLLNREIPDLVGTLARGCSFGQSDVMLHEFTVAAASISLSRTSGSMGFVR
jgi:hypothetical protein